MVRTSNARDAILSNKRQENNHCGMTVIWYVKEWTIAGGSDVEHEVVV
jgi:hypothetical protein